MVNIKKICANVFRSSLIAMSSQGLHAMVTTMYFVVIRNFIQKQ
jgi:hypothetical protein